MRIPDKLVIGRLVFCVLASAGLGLGCGDNGGGSPADAAVSDGATPDLATPDSGNRDAPADVPQMVDSGADGASDLRPSDGAAVDAPIDGGLGDGGSADAGADAADASSVDAGTLTQAAITFVLKNTGSTPLYLTSLCWIELKVSRLADGAVFDNASFCMCECSSTSCQGEMACAACPSRSGIAIAAGGSRELTWVAQSNSVQKKVGITGDYSCVAHSPITTGAYRLSVPVFSSEADAAAQTNPQRISADFQLGTSNARVEVKLQ